VFISKIALPSPFDKTLLVFQALFLTLGALLIGMMGATYVSLVEGFLTAFWRASTAPFTLTFALTYGLLVDSLIPAFKAKNSKGDVKTARIVAVVIVSTGIVGLASYYVSVFVVKIIARTPTVIYIVGVAINIMEIAILITGLVNGFIAGYVASYVWKRNLQQLIIL